MKKSINSFFQSPAKVIIVSLVIAIAVGVYGYMRINAKQVYTFAQASSGTIINTGGAATRNISLGFLAGGRIKSVTVTAGDTVKKGQRLATLDAGTMQGTLTQAQASLSQAQANYTKIVNGATGTTIDVARAQVNTAKVNVSEAQKQQDILVANAKRNLLNSTVVAIPVSEQNLVQAPIISGTYTGDSEGTITLIAYPTNTNGYFVFSGLVSGTGKISVTDPQPIGATGLSILFPNAIPTTGISWKITLPNTTAPNYLANYNAYQLALQTRTQTLATLQAAVDQANTNLTALVTSARPEDIAQAQAQIAQAQGTVEIAQAAYNNTIITAPYDGTVTSVSVSPGQIAVPNAPAIEIEVTGVSVSVPVMIPKSALISENDIYFVLKKNGTSVVKQKVTLGASDATNVEILTGLSVGDSVVTH